MTEKIGNDENDDISVNLLQDRIDFANKISVIEQEMADDHYTPSRMNDHVIPEIANEMHPGRRKKFDNFSFIISVHLECI